MLRMFLLLGFLLSVLLPSAAQAQSFNCRYARLPAEVAICQSPRLALMDEEMADKYYRVVNALRRAGMIRALRNFRREHRRWLRRRNACGYDRTCIAAAYAAWLTAMDDF